MAEILDEVGFAALEPALVAEIPVGACGRRLADAIAYPRRMPEVVLLRISPGGDYDEETAEVADQLLDAVRDLGYQAAVDEEALRWPGSGLSWSLALRWVGDYGGEVAAIGTFLLLLAEKVRAIFQSRGRPLPRYLELYGPDNEVISRVQMSDDDDA